MSEPFLGEIKMVGFGFAPRGWALCDGQILPIASNTALFSLLGTTYGGDGRTTFALPDLRGRSAKHVGTGAGLNRVTWGQRGGRETVALINNNMPSHNHNVRLKAVDDVANSTEAVDAVHANAVDGDSSPTNTYRTGETTDEFMGPSSIEQQNIGNNQAFDIQNPYLGVYHIIALQGLFPSRS